MVSIFGLRVTKKLLFLYLIIAIVIFCSLKVYSLFSLSSIEEFHPHLNLDDVNHLLKISRLNGINLILFDHVILEAWKDNQEIRSEGMCLFICHAVGPLAFVVTDSQVKDKLYYLSNLAQNGFVVTRFYNSENELAHIFLIRDGSPLHISVLHWRNAGSQQIARGYYKQYALHGPPHLMSVVKEFITVESWNILSVDRAYERFTSQSVVIDGLKMDVPKELSAFLKDHKGAHFIPCNQTRATYFNTKFGVPEKPEVIKFKHQAWKLLAKSKTLLDNLGIPFWLSSGTCLGFFRQCDIIPWAMDVDLGIFVDDYKEVLISEFEKRGLKLIHRFGTIEDSFELSFKENGMKVDLFFFYTEGATIWNGGTQVRTAKKFRYNFPHFTLCWTEFLDLKVRIPCQTKNYIEANYGQNWFTPVKHWDWKSSPPNVQENGFWPEELRKNVIVVKDL